MQGYKEYHIKLFQQHKLEDLSQQIKQNLNITGSNVNKCYPVQHEASDERILSFINKIISLTKDAGTIYDTEFDADTAAESMKPIIKAAYLELGYPLWGVKHVVLGDIENGYKVRYDLDIDTSG